MRRPAKSLRVFAPPASVLFLFFTLSTLAPPSALADAPRPQWQDRGLALSFVPITGIRRRTSTTEIPVTTPVYGLGVQAAYWLHPNVGLSFAYTLGFSHRSSAEEAVELGHYLDLRAAALVPLGTSVALRASAGPALIRTKVRAENPLELRPVQMALGLSAGIEAGGGRYSVRFEADSWIAKARFDLGFRVAIDVRF